MASTSIDTLQRGASGALNWFGILIFTAITLILWIGWFALNFVFHTKFMKEWFIFQEIYT